MNAIPAMVYFQVIRLNNAYTCILSLKSPVRESVSFCFSQAGTMETLYELRENGLLLGADELESFRSQLYNTVLPEFDQEESVTFDAFTSSVLYAMMDELDKELADQRYLDMQYDIFRRAEFKTCWFPKLHDVSSQRLQHLAPVGFYINSSPMEAMIMYSKMHGTVLIKKFEGKRVKKCQMIVWIRSTC